MTTEEDMKHVADDFQGELSRREYVPRRQHSMKYGVTTMWGPLSSRDLRGSGPFSSYKDFTFLIQN